MNIKDSGERTTFNTGVQRDMHSLWVIEMRCKKPECVDTPWKEEKA